MYVIPKPVTHGNGFCQEKNILLLHAKNKYKCSGHSPGYILFFDNFFDSSPLASWGTINTNPIL